MMTRECKRYTQEFKTEAVRLVIDQGYRIAEAARNLGLNANMLGRWVQAYKSAERKPPDRRGSEQELQRLRAQVKRLEQEREILKKAAAFFAREAS